MRDKSSADLTHDLLLPALLFASLGGMGWAVRGCSGFGAMNGCLFAGLNWAVPWWFISRDPTGVWPRRYVSGWIILALSLGFAVSGNRGWMQWPSFFEGHLQTNSARGEFVPVPKIYGFIWLFIAGVPWAGLGACLLAWCGSFPRLRARDWLLRLACGFSLAWMAHSLFKHFPECFLPLYKSLHAQYADLQANPNLRRLINDDRAAMLYLGLYLGFLIYEVGRRDWANAKLISIVGIVNGCGWAYAKTGNGHRNFGRKRTSIGGVAGKPAAGLASAWLMAWPISLSIDHRTVRPAAKRQTGPATRTLILNGSPRTWA